MKERYNPQNLYVYRHRNEIFVGYYKNSRFVADIFKNREFSFNDVNVLGPLIEYLNKDKSILSNRLPFVTKREIMRVLNTEEKQIKYEKKMAIKNHYKPQAIVFAEKAF